MEVAAPRIRNSSQEYESQNVNAPQVEQHIGDLILLLDRAGGRSHVNTEEQFKTSKSKKQKPEEIQINEQNAILKGVNFDKHTLQQ